MGLCKRPALVSLRVQARFCWTGVLKALSRVERQQPRGPPVPVVPSALQHRDKVKGGQSYARTRLAGRAGKRE